SACRSLQRREARRRSVLILAVFGFAGRAERRERPPSGSCIGDVPDKLSQSRDGPVAARRQFGMREPCPYGGTRGYRSRSCFSRKNSVKSTRKCSPFRRCPTPFFRARKKWCLTPFFGGYSASFAAVSTAAAVDARNVSGGAASSGFRCASKNSSIVAAVASTDSRPRYV